VSTEDFIFRLIDRYGFPVVVALLLIWERFTLGKKLVTLLTRIDTRLDDKGSKVLAQKPAVEAPDYGGTDR
jgi:hypothetical protein